MIKRGGDQTDTKINIEISVFDFWTPVVQFYQNKQFMYHNYNCAILTSIAVNACLRRSVLFD